MNLFSALLLSFQVINASRIFYRNISRLSSKRQKALSTQTQAPKPSRLRKFTSKMLYVAGGSIVTAIVMKNDNKKSLIEYIIDGENMENRLFDLEKIKDESENRHKVELSDLILSHHSKIKEITESSNEGIILNFRRYIYNFKQDQEWYEGSYFLFKKKFPEEMQNLNSTKNDQILGFIDMLREKLLENEQESFIILRAGMQRENLQNLKFIVSEIDKIKKV